MGSQYSNAVSKLRWAAGKAMENVRTVTGGSNDNELSIYNRLSSDEFKLIGEKYGQDGLIQYIKTMEAKKMRNNAA